MAKSMALGGGGRFAKCVANARKGGAKDPEAVCAARGRAKYGKAGFAALSKKGTGGAKQALAGMKKKKG